MPTPKLCHVANLWSLTDYPSAVVKHLSPENYIDRLLIRPDLIGRSVQFHFRPFNGHHCQVPVTQGDGSVTKELMDWLPFARATINLWLDTDNGEDRMMIAVPEMGPVKGCYNFEQLPNSWEEAIRLRSMLDQIWREALA